MSILNGDILFLEPASRRPDDTNGGRITSNVIASGQVGNLVPPVADADRVAGFVGGYKFFLALFTPNNDVYYKPWIFVAKPPENPGLGVCLFSTGDWFDTWADARSRLELYMAAGPRWLGRLLEKQLPGQRSFTLYQRDSVPFPEVGEVYALVANEGLPTEISQFVRATGVTISNQTLLIQGRSANYNIVTVTVAQPLEYLYDGGPITDDDSVQAPALVRTTRIADTVNLCGIKPLAQNASVGSSQIQVDSIYYQLVPSALAETAMAGIDPVGKKQGIIKIGQYPITFNTAAKLSPSDSIYIGSPCAIGTVSFGAISDDGRGNLISGQAVVGKVDYANGVLSGIDGSPNYSGTKIITFWPAAAPSLHCVSTSIGIDNGNRGYVYILTLDPQPVNKTLKVTYIAAGKIYSLEDNGDGSLSGADSSYGVGQFSYITNTLTITLQFLPDANSEIIIAWGVSTMVFDKSGTSLSSPEFRFKCAHEGAAPNTIHISWISGSAYSCHDDGHGNLGGNALGTVRYSSEGGMEVIVKPVSIPAPGTQFTIIYDAGPQLIYTIAAPAESPNGLINISLPDDNITPGSVEVYWQTTGTYVSNHYARDDGAGNFFGASGDIDYLSGEIVIATRFNATKLNYTRTMTYSGELTADQSSRLGGDETRSRSVTVNTTTETASEIQITSGQVSVRYRTGNSPDSHSETFTADTLIVELTPDDDEQIIPGSARFKIGTDTYTERGTVVYSNINNATGSGTPSGTLDYLTGNAYLTAWMPNSNNFISLQALACTAGRNQISDAVVQLPSRPVRAGSVQILASVVGGGAISIVAPSSGIIAEGDLAGIINHQTGVLHLRFGNWVDPAGHATDWWYDVRNQRADGMMWKPTLVYSDTLRVNAVATSYLPVSATEIGVNPAHFPGDGRVQDVKPGDDAVVHHESAVAIESPITPGMVVEAGRSRLYRVRVIDSNGLDVPPLSTTWSEHKDSVNGLTGIRFASIGLSLGSYAQPFTMHHQVIDMVKVADVDISGTVTVSPPISHALPSGKSFFSVALPLENMLVSLPVAFTQTTWTDEWSDLPIGDRPEMQYDSANRPIVLVNDGCIKERWAIILTGQATYKLIGEHLGIVAQGISINEDFSPVNPLTNRPYFTCQSGFLGLGGSAANVFRFNTDAAHRPIWPIVTTLPGNSPIDNDSFVIQVIGNAE